MESNNERYRLATTRKCESKDHAIVADIFLIVFHVDGITGSAYVCEVCDGFPILYNTAT